MKSQTKTNQKRIDENTLLKQRIQELERLEAGRKWTEAALQVKDWAIESAINAIAISDLEGNLNYVNPAFLKLWGYSAQADVLGKSAVGFWQMGENAAEVMEALRARGGWSGEMVAKSRDGSLFGVQVAASMVMNAAGESICMLASFADTTERKRAEEELRKSQEQLRDAHRLAHIGIWNWIVDTDTVTWTEELYRIAGLDPMIPAPTYAEHRNIYAPESWDRLKAAAEKSLRTGAPYQLELELIRPDGTTRWVNAFGGTTYDNHGLVTGLHGTLQDITERKRAEEAKAKLENQRQQTQKMESLGILAGGIAHDFNNLMAIVQGYIDLALIELSPDHVSRQRLLAAMKSVEQTKDLTSRLITFSRVGGPHGEIYDVAEIIRDAARRIVKGTEVRVKIDFMENLWPVEADELQMKQVFYNLTTNAVEAMPQGGNLTIQAENALMPAREVLGLKEGPYLKITFTDEGIGIPEEHLSKIFDPYFTTKGMAAQKGLGLGLAVCYSVLKKHGGHITVKSQPEKGSSFILYLPAREDLAKRKEVKKTSSTGTVRVLIMDDEHHIRAIERVYLEQMGHEVTDVKDGQEAIDAYRKALRSGMPFDLVMLDLTVRRGLGGQLTMERLLKIDPAIKAIIASGFVDDPVIENYADYGFQGALRKPFKGEEMKSLVEEILHG